MGQRIGILDAISCGKKRWLDNWARLGRSELHSEIGGVDARADFLDLTGPIRRSEIGGVDARVDALDLTEPYIPKFCVCHVLLTPGQSTYLLQAPQLSQTNERYKAKNILTSLIIPGPKALDSDTKQLFQLWAHVTLYRHISIPFLHLLCYFIVLTPRARSLDAASITLSTILSNQPKNWPKWDPFFFLATPGVGLITITKASKRPSGKYGCFTLESQFSIDLLPQGEIPRPKSDRADYVANFRQLGQLSSLATQRSLLLGQERY